MIISTSRNPRHARSKPAFPVVYSTLSPQALVEQVLSNYSIEPITNCLLWNRGLSDVYLVETEQEYYVLRVSHHHWRSRLDIEFELELLDFLYQNSLPVAYPLRTRADDLFVTVEALEGDRYAALFPYAKGTVPLGDLTIAQSEIFGRSLAKLHQIGTKFRPSHHSLILEKLTNKTLSLEYLLDHSLTTIAPFLEERPEDLKYLRDNITQIKAELKILPRQSPLWTACWGDPHSGNIHFTEDNQITLFDFDQCGYGWRAFDIAKFLQVSLRAGMNRKIRDAFFEGYQTVQKLTSEEEDCLQALTQTAHIWAWAININASVIHCWSRLDYRYFSKRLETLKRLNSPDWQLF
nr:phosphotransferase [Xenococcus sp. PCC 7305]